MKIDRQSLRITLFAVLAAFLCSCGGGGDTSSENADSSAAVEGAEDRETSDPEPANLSLPEAKFSEVVRTCGQVNGPLRILPFGDSITESERGHNSYRRDLWKTLQAAGCRVDFVGSERGVSTGERDGPSSSARNPDFDQDNEGHWDYRADELRSKLRSALSRYRPHIVLMHVGTNDIVQDQSTSSTIRDIDALLQEVTRFDSDAIIFLAKIIPHFTRQNQTRDLNSKMGSLVRSTFSPEYPIAIVDQSQGYSTSDNYDGIHPAASGEAKIAAKWAAAILGLVEQG